MEVSVSVFMKVSVSVKMSVKVSRALLKCDDSLMIILSDCSHKSKY